MQKTSSYIIHVLHGIKKQKNRQCLPIFFTTTVKLKSCWALKYGVQALFLVPVDQISTTKPTFCKHWTSMMFTGIITPGPCFSDRPSNYVIKWFNSSCIDYLLQLSLSKLQTPFSIIETTLNSHYKISVCWKSLKLLFKFSNTVLCEAGSPL